MKSVAPKPPARPRGRPRSFDRDAALERAMEVFWAKGYESTSMCDLTEAMGINPPSLYAAFGDKEQLFLEALERYYDLRSETVTCAYDEPTARGAIERILREFADQACHGGNRGCMVVMAMTTCTGASRELQAALALRRNMARSRLKARFDRAVAEGELAKDTDTNALTDFYNAIFQGMSLQARDGASRKSLLATAEAAMRAWPVSSDSKHVRSVGNRKLRSVA